MLNKVPYKFLKSNEVNIYIFLRITTDMAKYKKAKYVSNKESYRVAILLNTFNF